MQVVLTKGGTRVSLLVVLALVAGLLAIGGLHQAEATFPGTNGLIAFIRTGDIFTVNPGALGETRITFTGGISSVNWNAAATRLTFHTGSGVAFVPPTPGAAATGLPGGAGGDTFPAFNTTGSQVTFSNAGELFTQDVNGANRTNITNSGAVEVDPDWSSDGSFIAYVNLTTGNIERRSPTGGGLIVLTPAGTCAVGADICIGPSIFPDLSRVAFGNQGAVPNGIFSVLANGASAAAFQHTTGPETFAAVSPDNNRIVFGVPGAGLNTADGQVVTSTAGDAAPSWGSQQVAPSPSPGVSPSPVPVGPGTQSGTITRTKGGPSRKQVQVCDTPVSPTPPLPAGTPSCIVIAKKVGSYSRSLPAGTYTKTAETGKVKRRTGEFRVKQACTLNPPSPVIINPGATTTVNIVCPK